MNLTLFSTLLGNAVLASQILIAVLLLNLFLGFLPKKINLHFQKYGLWYAWILSIAALFGPLIYAEIYLFEPCRYCWFQRIFMFPQVFLIGTALTRKKHFSKTTRNDLFWYSMPMVIIGGLIGIYHYLLQFGYIGSSSVGCGAVGQSVACNSLYILEKGYITIPMMALTAFVGIGVFLLYSKKYNSQGWQV